MPASTPRAEGQAQRDGLLLVVGPDALHDHAIEGPSFDLRHKVRQTLAVRLIPPGGNQLLAPPGILAVRASREGCQHKHLDRKKTREATVTSHSHGSAIEVS